MKTYVLTSDPYKHHIKEFANRFPLDREVVVVGYSPLGFDLPDNFSFVSLGDEQVSFSDGLIKLLGMVDEYFTLFLEDYFVESIDEDLMAEAEEYAVKNKVGRLCLEKAHLTGKKFYWEDYDGMWMRRPQNAPYLLAVEPSIWNRDMYLKYLVPGEDAWHTEKNTSNRAKNKGELILAPSVPIVKYYNYINKGNVRKNWDKQLFGA